MKLVLGLDVSTSVTGICLLDADIPPDDKGSHILYLDRIEFKKCKTFFDKADVVHDTLVDCRDRLGWKLDHFALEEPLMGFSKGMSSAATITTLMRFNGITSYIGRQVFGVEPQYISAASARKLCGVKLQKTKIAGISQKEQVFLHMSNNDLKHVTWPLKPKSGAPVDWSRDATDAYVISRACSILNK